MFKFKKQVEINDSLNVNYLIENNPTLFCVDSRLWDAEVLELDYNKDSGEYEAYLTIPCIDENFNSIEEYSNKSKAHLHFSPMYCILSKNIYTKDDYERIYLKKTKVEELKRLLKKIEEI